MDFLDIVHTRRSIRKFTDEPVSPGDVDTLLHAAMVSPTATNSQSWRFVVIDDKNLLKEIPKIHPYATPAAGAPLAILVCGDVEAGHAPECWPQDGAAAIQTMLLTARSLNLGSVWSAIHPFVEREDAFIKLFGLPGTVRPLGLVILGHPAQPFTREDRYDDVKVHYNHW